MWNSFKADIKAALGVRCCSVIARSRSPLPPTAILFPSLEDDHAKFAAGEMQIRAAGGAT